MMHLLQHRPDYATEVFAEARALLDDGLDLDFVLDLFPEDASWLRPELELSANLAQALAAEPASYYFEASLKSRFLSAAAERPAPALPAPGAARPFKTAVATLSLATAAVAVGVATIGFVTAGNAVPGDWNYGFKLAGERLQYALAPSNQRVDIRLHQAEARVYEIQQLARHGNVSPTDITNLQDDMEAIASISKTTPLDDSQKVRLQGVAETGQAALNTARASDPSLDAPVLAAGAAIHEALAVALATPTVAPESPTPSPATPTASPVASTPSATATPALTPSPTPSASPVSPTSTPTQVAAETSTPSATPGATGDATPSPTP